MILSDVSVRRPVLATVMSLVLIVFGAIAFFQLPLRELPDVDQPIVGISVSYAGASAQVIETQVTRPIEDQLSGIEGIDTITSSSRDGRASVNVLFKLDRNIDDAANDVQNAVARVTNQIPADADRPVVSKNDADSAPFLWFSLRSSAMSSMELSDFARRYFADRLSTLDGVSSVRIGGEFKPSMKVWLDTGAMAARGLTVDDVENALRSQNLETPAGSIEGKTRDYSLRVERNFQNPADFARLPVSRDPNAPVVRLGDVARIVVEPEELRRTFRADGEPAVGIGIVRQSKSNALDVADLVRAEVAELAKGLPEGANIQLHNDSTVFISEAVKEVYKTLGEAVLLVVLVIFLFLGSMRAAAIPAAVIPVCLIGVFSLLAALGFSINLLTLLALVLSIGIVVDDSIVVLENIQRRVDEGEPPKVAALHGTRQVAFAVIATSAVLVAVFTPLLFVGGYVGKLFIELAATVAGVVIISMFCSLTLTPMMCSLMLKPVKEGFWLIRKVENVLERVRASYRRSLEAALHRKVLVYGAFAFVTVLGGYLFVRLPSELLPKEDRGVLQVMMRAPEGAGYDYTRQVLNQAEAVLLTYKKSGEADHIMAMAPTFNDGSFSGGQLQVYLTDWSKRERSGVQIAAEIDNKLAQITGAQFRVNMQDAIRGSGGDPGISLGGADYAPLAAIADRIVDRLRQSDLVTRPRSNYLPNSPRVLIDIDRERAAALGVSVQSVGRALESTMGSRRVNTFTESGLEYYVYVQAERDARSEITDLTNQYVRSGSTGELVPLSAVVSLKNVGDLSQRQRLNRLASVEVSGALPPGVTVGAAIEEIERVARAEIGNQAVTISYVGAAKTYKDASGAIYFAFGFALLIVFLVLAAQFESFIHPLVIMLCVPLAIAGGLFGLFLFGSTLNIYSQIGIIILIALAAKNGILIVEFANQLRDEGRAVRDAVVAASDLRLRPILMTSAATIMGAVPLILGEGAGAESRRTIGVVIVFGVLLSTLLTLFVVPAFYDLLARFTRSPEATRREIEAYGGEGSNPHAHPAE